MLEALEKSLGVVTTACKATGIPRKTFYNWCNSDRNFQKAYSDMSEIALDFAESKLHSRIRDGSDTAIIFFLKTQGKSRGYIERQELEVNERSAFVITTNKQVVEKALKVIHQKTGTNG